MPVELREMTLEQRRQLIDTQQIWEAWSANRAQASGYTGSMGWKLSSGKEYLVRQAAEGGLRRMRSLGPRSAETERILEQFRDNKEAVKASLKKMSDRLTEMARVNRALKLGRVPIAAANIARNLHRHGLLGRSLLVVATHAVFAFEAGPGVFVDTSMLATGDLDILFDARARLRLRADGEAPSLMRFLKEVDPTYEQVTKRGFRAVNSEGFYVDLIKATPKNVITSTETYTVGDSSDLHASHVRNMRWVTNAPKFSATAIGADGFPVPFACPDPRA